MATTKPEKYQSTYDDQIKDIANRIINREDFSYDVNGDALYQQYKDMYTQQGKQAMMDAMGQAATMTGGYGNSFAQSVGQQAYQDNLQQLNGVIPELYQLALDTYSRKGADMYDQFSMLGALEDQNYGRYRDQMADYYTDRDFDYQAQRDQVSDQQWQKEFDEMVRQYNQNYALNASKSSGSGSGGSSGSKSGGSSKSSGSSNSGGSSVDSNAAAAVNPKTQGDPTNYSEVLAQVRSLSAGGVSSGEISGFIHSCVSDGIINQNQAQSLLKNYT